MARFDVVTFDCYGTLIDWEGGIREAFRRAAAADGVTLSVRGGPRRVRRDRAGGRGRRPTGAIARCSRRRRSGSRRGFGWKIDAERARFLPESLPSWQPFPDTNPALARLAAAGCRLGILSNVDDDLLAGTRRLLEASFDPVITAAQVRSYKPAPAHFLAARRLFPAGTRWLHAAQSYFHDVVPVPPARHPRRLDQPEEREGRSARARPTGRCPTWRDLADWMAS